MGAETSMKEIVVTLPQLIVVVLLLVFMIEIIRSIVILLIKTKKPVVQAWSKLGLPLEDLDERKIKK